MSENIPRWITNLALDIYKLIQKYDALAYFQGKVKKWVLAHQGEIDRHKEWENKRKQLFENRLDEEPRLQDKNAGPPEEDWRWETSVIHRFDSAEQRGLRRTSKKVSGWVPPELSISTEPKITRLLPLTRDHILTLEEKYTLLAAIYDSGRRGTDQIPTWEWPDLSMELSSDELSDAKKRIFFEGLCKQILIIPQDNEGWLRTILADVEKDVSNWTAGELSQPKKKFSWKKIWATVVSSIIILAALTTLILNLDRIKETIPQNDVNKTTAETKTDKKVKDITLLYLFENDFDNLLRASEDRILTDKDGSQTTVKSKLYLDFESQTEFVGFYIPPVPETFDICIHLAEHYKTALELAKKVMIESSGIGLQPVNISELKFSGRVFIYHEYPLLEAQKRELFTLYKKHDLSPQFRGTDYLFKKKQGQSPI